MRHACRRALVAVTCALLGACGISDEESAVHIDFDEFTATSAPPESSSAAPPGSGARDTTTPGSPDEAPLVPFRLYFAAGAGLVAADVELPAEPSLLDVADALVAGPGAGHAAAGSRSLVQAGLIRTLTLRDNRLTIDLSGSVFEPVDSAEQRQLIGQLVLTFAEHPGVDGIEQWLFTIDQRPLRVIRRDGTLSQPGVPVTRADYDVLLDTGRTP